MIDFYKGIDESLIKGVFVFVKDTNPTETKQLIIDTYNFFNKNGCLNIVDYNTQLTLIETMSAHELNQHLCVLEQAINQFILKVVGKFDYRGLVSIQRRVSEYLETYASTE